MSGKGGPPRLGTQYSWPPAGHPAPLDRPGATPPLPPQAWGRPSLSVCFQEPEKQGPEFSGESPPGGVVPPPPPSPLLRVLLWRAPCRALDLHHIRLHGNPRKGATPSPVEGGDSEKQSDFSEENTRYPRLKPKDGVCGPLRADSFQLWSGLSAQTQQTP